MLAAWFLETYTTRVASDFFLFSAFFFVLYFLIPILKNPYKIIDLGLLPLLVLIIFDHFLLFWMVIGTIVVYASLYLSFRSLYLYLLYLTAIVVLAPILEQEWLLAFVAFLGSALFSFTIINWKQADAKSETYKDQYESIYSLYRSSKRQVGDLEKVTRQEERNQIAREIHDSVGHRLTALTMQLEAARLQAKDSESQKTFAQLKTLAQDSLADTRSAVKTFKTEDTAGIQAVIQLIRKLESESQLRVAITMKTGVLGIVLSNKQSVTLYRSIQEALTNMMRHSLSRQAAIEFQIIAQRDLRFQVTHPLKEKVTITEGFGLTNMRERLSEIGGRLTVSQSGEELHLIGQFPLEVKNDD
ncbi:sensor histidine kinase [Tetragenococcus koreensis]|uniref:sensor histidine kinase n=2 Tax=Tetragenococcus koreensis TaxID=290335 RepID=UPI000F4D397B|nr:histidine kinase [Tetragenococcus koreensis]AYW45953.1 sensor histidine kinase [Tetragenococcus koreensis]MCF1621350.1 histidine kinase [Tetragenococcus koreensis]MCF1677400.1 histidine kinase [Tetragenococcus koreensis]MCF1679729.1 histidine kinase [Tetragenococcus koreensis]MCF1682091.1 histidine kinase [Tetragenococcus koreensis]